MFEAMVLVLLYSLAALVFLVPCICVVAWVVYTPLAARIFGEPPMLLAESFPPLEGGEECEFPTTDGLTLRGSYLPTTAEERLGVIAFFHELNADRWTAGRYVADLRCRGYDLFAPDFRNHGESDPMPGYRPLPWITQFEVADAQAAIDYLCTRSDRDPNGVGIIGISRGGTAALCVAGRDRRVRAVVTDGAFPTKAMQVHYFRRFMGIFLRHPWLYSRVPDFALAMAAMWTRVWLSFRLGCRFVNVEQAVRRVRRPVLFIHGRRDSMVPVEIAHRMRRFLSVPSKLWVVPGAKHNESVVVAQEEYHRRVARFFGWHLAPRRRRARSNAALATEPATTA